MAQALGKTAIVRDDFHAPPAHSLRSSEIHASEKIRDDSPKRTTVLFSSFSVARTWGCRVEVTRGIRRSLEGKQVNRLKNEPNIGCGTSTPGDSRLVAKAVAQGTGMQYVATRKPAQWLSEAADAATNRAMDSLLKQCSDHEGLFARAWMEKNARPMIHSLLSVFCRLNSMPGLQPDSVVEMEAAMSRLVDQLVTPSLIKRKDCPACLASRRLDR